MMNTRKLAGKALKTVKDSVNAAISHHHSTLQVTGYKSAEQVEATCKILQCLSSGAMSPIIQSFNLCNHSENETSRGTVFQSKMHLANQKKLWNTHLSLPLEVSHTHISCTNNNSSTPGAVLPVPYQFKSGIADSALTPKYDGFFSHKCLSKIPATQLMKPKMTQQRRMMSTRAANANRGTIEGIITTLNDKFNADIVNETQAIYQFNILSGDRREIYYIDLRNGSGSAGKGKSEGNPDTIFCIDAENFNRLVEGNLKAPTAFMTGRMKISGSMQKAAKLEKLFITLLDK